MTKKLVSLDMEIGRNTLQNGDGETLHSVSLFNRSYINRYLGGLFDKESFFVAI